MVGVVLQEDGGGGRGRGVGGEEDWKDDRETQGPRVIGHRFYLNFNVRLMSAVEAAKSSSATALSHTAHSDTARHGRREGA